MTSQGQGVSYIFYTHAKFSIHSLTGEGELVLQGRFCFLCVAVDGKMSVRTLGDGGSRSADALLHVRQPYVGFSEAVKH